MFGSARSIQLVRLFGIRIGASPSWFLVLFVVIYLLTGYFREVLDSTDTTAFIVAVLAALLFFVSLTLHELGHAVAAKRHGIRVSGIDLWLLGGMAKLDRDSRTPGEEFKIAVAGPLVTLALVVIGFLVALVAAQADADVLGTATLSEESTTPVAALAGLLTAMNAVLLGLNLLPAYPLDGGRIARAVAWKITGNRSRATRAAATVGRGFGWVIVAGGLLLATTTSPFDGLWLMIVGWFIVQGARSAIFATQLSDRLDGVTAADLMDDEPVAVPALLSAERAHEEFFLRYGYPWFPVVDEGGRYAGVLREERVDAAVEAGRSSASTHELLDGDSGDEFRVPDDEPLEALLGSEPLRRLGGLAVVDGDGRLRGVVTLERVRRALAASAGSRLA